MVNCEMLNLGLELDYKIKENEQLAGAGSGEIAFLSRIPHEEVVMATKR
jgi:hypothetical protein